MRRLALALACALAALPLLGGLALPEPEAVDAGIDYIRTTQEDDGGFGGFGPGQTMDAIYAIRAAGLDPATFVSPAGNTPADFLLAQAATLDDPGAAAKATLGAIALGLDPRDISGVDLEAIIEAGYDAETGRYAEAGDFSQAVVVIALAVAGAPIPQGAVDSLLESQVEDGGWGFDGMSDPDTTAIVAQALLAAGSEPSQAAVAAALDHLGATQNADGGWGFGGESNASSTAFVVQALLAAGEDPRGPAYTREGGDPVAFLLSQRQADGSFLGFDPAFATNQVVPALAGRSFAEAPLTPLREVEPEPPPSPTPAPQPPAPPATGSGQAAGGNAVPALVLAGLLLVATGAITALAPLAAGRRSAR